MSTGTKNLKSSESPSVRLELPPPARDPMVERVASQLVARARAEGVSLTGPDGVATEFVRRVLELGLEVEMAEHLGYEHGDRVAAAGADNVRNGSSDKTVSTELGKIKIAMPRDRNGSFTPVTVPKHVRRLDGFDAMIVALYTKGMTTYDIQLYLRQIYGVEVSVETVSKITDAVVEQMGVWQCRPLDAIYPVILIDAIMVKIRDGQVSNRPVYVVIGVNMEGEREVLGLWVGPTGGEGAKFWLTVLTDLKNRGVKDSFIVCCDGLKGLPESIRATWPLADVQTCVVHLVRNALRYVSKKHWGKVTKDMREIYTAPSLQAAEARFAQFKTDWEATSPAMIKAWESAWTEFVPFLDFPVELRKIVYTTNAIESVNARFRKADPDTRALPERAGRAQGAVPHDHGPDTEPGQRHRPHPRLETHPQHSYHSLRRPASNQPHQLIHYKAQLTTNPRPHTKILIDPNDPG